MRIIAGEWRGRRITPPPGRAVRPTTDRVRESWMSAMGGRFDGLHVWDLCAGSGALGLECLSRGAASCVFVEKAAPVVRVIEANAAALGAGSRARIVRSDVIRWLDAQPPPEPVDLVVADPPYATGLATELLERFAAAPFARQLWVEHRSGDIVPDLPGLRQRRYGDTTLSTLDARAPTA